MWDYYRETLVRTQTLTLLVCVVMFIFLKVPLIGVAVCFLAMQLGAVIGAWWAVRLKRKIALSRGALPLSR